MQTPFDELKLELIQKTIKNARENPPISETEELISRFTGILRSLYLQMKDQTYRRDEEFDLMMGIEREKPNPRHLTIQETLEMGDYTTISIFQYFQYLEQVNILGRVLYRKVKQFPPLYHRVYFYRNKMIEHWDDYLDLFLGSGRGNGLIYKKGEISIPYHLAHIFRPIEGTQMQQKLIDDFASLGVTLTSIENKWYGDYSKVIFMALENIDPQLRSKPNKINKKHIPEFLVEDLFRYSFPTPITNIENYSLELAKWLKSIC